MLIFWISVAAFIVTYGKCRQWMIGANKAAKLAKTRYNDTHTIYLDGRPYCDGAAIYIPGEGSKD